MTESRRIAVATFGRSDFSILRPLCELLDADPGFDVGLWVAGAHFEATSGRTVEDVEASGLDIWERIEVEPSDRSDVGTVDVMADHLRAFARTAATSRPDMVLILGDRFEAVSAGLAMVPVRVPVGHISGGSITEGAIDDTFRHCLTKIAAIHFCDLPRFARRIHLMGEPTDRIITSGALGLDAFRDSPIHAFDDFVERFGLTGLQSDFVLATLHPESNRPEVTADMAAALIASLATFDRDVVFTYPNADPGADLIVRAIELASTTHPRMHVVRGFGPEWFSTALSHASLVVGNSSSGIIEAASFELPVVDIGDRQRGRDHGPNVVHCDRDAAAIGRALELATAPEFEASRTAPNPYGDGRGRERVLAALQRLDWNDVAGPKRFAAPDADFTGEALVLT